jgi:hypothetical protein
VQDLDLSEATVSAAVGIRRGLAVEAIVPFRRVVARIRFLDNERAPLVRPGEIAAKHQSIERRVLDAMTHVIARDSE